MTTITLSCLVWGDNPYENVFAVDIESTKLVSHLKKAIKAEQPKTFANVDAKNLKLWKVNIPLDEPEPNQSFDNTKFNMSIKEGFPDVKLLTSINEISEYFSMQPARKHLHILIQHDGGIQENAINDSKPGKSNNSMSTQIVKNVNETNRCEGRYSIANICIQSMISTTTEFRNLHTEQSLLNRIYEQIKNMFGYGKVSQPQPEVVINASKLTPETSPISNANETNRCNVGFALVNYCQQYMVTTATKEFKGTAKPTLDNDNLDDNLHENRLIQKD